VVLGFFRKGRFYCRSTYRVAIRPLETQ
jgi:hypothetical protein